MLMAKKIYEMNKSNSRTNFHKQHLFGNKANEPELPEVAITDLLALDLNDVIEIDVSVFVRMKCDIVKILYSNYFRLFVLPCVYSARSCAIRLSPVAMSSLACDSNFAALTAAPTPQLIAASRFHPCATAFPSRQYFAASFSSHALAK